MSRFAWFAIVVSLLGCEASNDADRDGLDDVEVADAFDAETASPDATDPQPGFHAGAWAGPDAAPYRTGAIEAMVREVPAATQEGIFVAPGQHVADLVQYLVGGTDDAFLKAKRLHDWIADNIAYDVEAYFSGALPPQDYASVLLRRSAVCAGYANLFLELATRAGLSAEVIPGVSRGYSYSVDGTLGGHAWNGVTLDGHDYLLDVTWDAGVISGELFEREYSTAYLFLAPEGFIYEHLPDQADRQLLGEPVTEDAFVGYPSVYKNYFELGAYLLQPFATTLEGGQEVTLELLLPAASSVAYAIDDGDLQFLTGDGDLWSGLVPVPADAAVVTVYALVPGGSGMYSAVLYFTVI